MKKRIILFTGTHLHYTTNILEPLLTTYGNQITHVFISDTLFDFAFLRKRFRFFVENLYPFCIKPGDLFRFLHWKWSGRRNKYGHKSVMEFVNSYGIPCDYIREIRSEATLNMLKSLHPDLFLLCLFDKIAREPFLKIPRLGTFNVHMGKLPEHRGGLSAFWVLRLGDTQAGSTLHEAVPKLDAGRIIAEIRFPVQTTSMKELMDETVKWTSHMIVEGLEKIFKGEVVPVSTEGRSEGYYLLPASEDFRAFYRRGCRLI